jgi:HK97 family phage major capsid protein
MANIARSDLSGAMLPEQYLKLIIQEAAQSSVLLSLARTVPMARGTAKQPVLTTLPQAAWISPRDTGRKPTTTADWDDVTLTAEEMAVIIPVPEAVIDDSDYDLWGEVTPLVGQEFGRLLDLAGIFGTGPFLAGDSIVEKAIAAGNSVAIGDAITLDNGRTTADLADYLNVVMGMVEADGFAPSGWAAPISQRARLRGLRNAQGDYVYQATASEGGMPTVFGEQIAWSRNGGWDAAATTGALFVAGDFTKAIVGVRQDVTVKLLTEATITDGAGNVVLSLAEQDMVALRMVFRVAFATANPVTPLNTNVATRSPFAVLQADATP